MKISTCFAALAAAASFVGSVDAQSLNPKPTGWASIAEPTSTVEGPNTPRWNEIKKALDAAKRDGGVQYKKLFLPSAEAVLTQDGAKAPFTADILKAVVQSCLGPYLYDEGKTWLQFSWVCHTSSDTPLSRVLTFRNSPELGVTLFYEGSHVSRLLAEEPGWVPGARRLSMDAAERIKAK
ncbi:MAG: hypothetical protein WC889_08405 [Myxococcota bacterium]